MPADPRTADRHGLPVRHAGGQARRRRRRRLRRHRDLRARPRSPRLVAGRDPARCADLGPVDRPLPAVPRPRLHRRRALRRATCAAPSASSTSWRALGTDTVLVCSSVAPDAVDDPDRLAGAAARPGRPGRRARAAARLRGARLGPARRHVGARPGTPSGGPTTRRSGLCLDSFHVLSRGGDPAGSPTIPGEKIFFLQLADAPLPRHGRAAVEPPPPALPRPGRLRPAALPRRVLRRRVRRARCRSRSSTTSSARPTPAAPPWTGMRSLLWLGGGRRRRRDRRRRRAGAGADRARLRRARGRRRSPARRSPTRSTALGFAHTGQHRSKPVQLWEQGRARVLLNASVVRPAATGLAAVAALALESTDPRRSARRAEALRRPSSPARAAPPRPTSPPSPPPTAPQVFFARTGARRAGPPTSCRPAASRPRARASPRVDHVALTQPFDAFDEAALFYRAVLGLRARRAWSRSRRPFGLVRSRAVTDPDRRVRLALTVSLLRRGEWAPGVPEPQHIAFATDDVVATARAAARRPAPRCSPSRRTTTTTSRRASTCARAARGVPRVRCPVRPGAAGAYLHVCTEVLGGRVFVASSSGWATTTGTAGPTRRCAWAPTAGSASRAGRSPRAEAARHPGRHVPRPR